MAYTVTMPKLGLTMTEGTVTGWLKNVGDVVKKGDPLFEVETDKITNQVEALAEGILRKIIVPEGDAVPVGTAVAILAAAHEPLPEGEDRAVPTQSKEAATPAPVKPTCSPQKAVATPTQDLKASPAAKKLARDRGVDLTLIKPTRTDGRIVERDVLAYLEANKAAATVEAAEETGPASKAWVTPVAEQLAKELGVDLTKLAVAGRIGKEDVFSALLAASREDNDRREPLVGVRKIIAERMAASKRVAPHVTYTMEVDMSRAQAVYAAYKAQDRKISYNDMVVLAAARALRQFPLANASLVDEEIVYHSYINVGIAVALAKGLIVPVVKNADQKTLYALGLEIRALATRARENKLSPEDIAGGTFTVTNLGMYGIDSFTPIINQPESAILGVGRIADKPVVENGAVVVKPMMTLSLSADHRLLDGAIAAEFLSLIKAFLEEPALML